MSPPSRFRRWRRLILAALALGWIGMAYWQAHKPLPEGTNLASKLVTVPADNVSFIADISAADAYGRPVLSQAIFDEVLRVVRSARRFIVLDYFLFNDWRSPLPGTAGPLRAISGELRDALIEQRRAHPELKVLFITDPINEVYGSEPSRDLILLRAAGVDVVVTNLDVLRDSNLVYSGLWRLGISWWDGNGRGTGWLPNPLDENDRPITFGAWARLANFKANHRKVTVADDGQNGLTGIVASANPHDASSAHSNVAVKVTGPALAPLLQSEISIARFSGWQGNLELPDYASGTRPEPAAGADESDLAAGRVARVQLITEGAIFASVLQHLGAAGKGDNVDIAMFYLSSRAVVESLLEASRRGAAIRLILDPNKDAFGHEKSGIPNTSVASELMSTSDGKIRVRWYRTHGEQFHTKLAMVYGAERLWVTLGSANLTRRNLESYNLEANVAIEVALSSALATQLLGYYDTLWSNRAALGIEYTADFAVYADPAQSHYWLYRVMEATGLSTF
jgi:phosphatidylserine/phosphatidylglycerophosphate/cardiolipin synthase-like enzyme